MNNDLAAMLAIALVGLGFCLFPLSILYVAKVENSDAYNMESE